MQTLRSLGTSVDGVMISRHAALLASALLATGCNGGRPSHSVKMTTTRWTAVTPSAPHAKHAAAGERAVSLGPPIFLIAAKVDDGGVVSGTCFYLAGPNGRWIITANHVIREADADSIIARIGNTSVPLRIVAQDRATDLAALTPSRSLGYTPLSLRDTSPRRDETVSFAGFPIPDVMGVSTPTTVRGVVSNDTSTVGGMADFKIDAPTTGGDSGAPVLDAQNKVVGIIIYPLITGSRHMRLMALM